MGKNPCPADFDEFWDARIAEIDKTDYEVKLVQVDYPSAVADMYDLYFTGTFPRTDLKWGFGFDANFMFQSYASVVKPNDDEIFSPFFTPSVLLAYDILLKKTATVIYKLTPMLKVGITCYPMVPDYFMENMSNYNYLNESSPENWYSGFYIELSVSTSFMSFQWKK